MATVTRQPFAPLDGARLQTLTSLKNRQNAIPTSSSVKRKASAAVDTDDSENVDPTLFSKRAKGTDSFFPSKDSFIKPQSFILTKAASSGDVSLSSPPKVSTPRPRAVLNPKSPAAKLNTSIARSAPLSAPAGRSPTRGKRSGILSSRRRTAGSYSRVDPPVFGLSKSASSPAPFSLDAALKGTIPSYTGRSSDVVKPKSLSSSSTPAAANNDLREPESMKSSWFFDIHEDTPEQEMTNLLQHSTCVLDISSDEESESRRQRERAEGKENVPPLDDVSQTTASSRSRARHALAADDEMVFEKERNPLGEMNVKDYYSEGCDETSVIIVPADEEEEEDSSRLAKSNFQFAPELKPMVPAPTSVSASLPAIATAEAEAAARTVEELMRQSDEPAPAARLLQPMEGTGESFEVWESGSARDETETSTTAVEEAAVAC
ncbi:hypothetical protein GGR56DRAFT_80801 [Xylariaceae sp. FL0804]|nr:hypothetical protein GGR56DRAFT_80801 [Xylariaceae sp. FL0804]